MQYNKFHSTTQGELNIPILSMGCMRLPVKTPGGEDIDYDRAQEIFDYAMANGVNYFDTAAGYHSEGSEPFVGHALEKYPRESYYLATKLSAWYIADGETSIDEFFAGQQKRLKTDWFDFYLVHCINDFVAKVMEERDVYDTLVRYKKEGRIKNLGFSFHGSLDLLSEVVSKYEWDFAQIQFNYLDAEYGDAMKEYEIIHNAGIPIIVMEPVRGGALANLCQKSNGILRAAEPNSSVASWAIRYAASFPGVFTVLSGMSSLEQITDNIKTMSDFKPLGDSQMAALKKAAAAFKEFYNVPCTSCKYCMDTCPSKINVPELIKLHSSYKLHKDEHEYKRKYMKIDEEKRAEACISCTSCEDKCPQNILITDIMDEMKELNAKLGI
ncbi:MAG: aldo/keto reductase [Oscillospiraceae bacterium]|nr:aldo/keto reductase [Oscillospiraceae bacterium]